MKWAVYKLLYYEMSSVQIVILWNEQCTNCYTMKCTVYYIVYKWLKLEVFSVKFVTMHYKLEGLLIKTKVLRIIKWSYCNYIQSNLENWLILLYSVQIC